MIEVGFSNPLRMAGGKTACCGGEVYVDISFEVSAEGMDGKKDTREKPFLVCPIFDDRCGNKWNTVHKIPIQPEEIPEFFRHGKGNMLPGSFWQCVKTIFDPDVSSLLAA